MFRGLSSILCIC